MYESLNQYHVVMEAASEYQQSPAALLNSNLCSFHQQHDGSSQHLLALRTA